MVGTVRLVRCTGMHRRSELTRGYPRLAAGSWQGIQKVLVRKDQAPGNLRHTVHSGRANLPLFPPPRIKATPSADALSQASPPPYPRQIPSHLSVTRCRDACSPHLTRTETLRTRFSPPGRDRQTVLSETAGTQPCATAPFHLSTEKVEPPGPPALPALTKAIRPDRSKSIISLLL